MQMKNKKIRNILFFLTIIVFSLFIMAFNYFVDPYGYNDMKSKNFSTWWLKQDMVYTYINKTKKLGYKNVIIGASPAERLFPPSLFYIYTRENIASLTKSVISLNDHKKLLEYFIKLHPEVKKVYVSIEFPSFINRNYSKLEKQPTQIQEFLKLYYSFEVTFLSFQKVKNKIFSKIKKEKQKQNEGMYKVYKNIRYDIFARDYEDCVRENIFQIKEIKEFLDSKNIESVYFIPPVHALFFCDLYINGNLEKIEFLKKELSKVVQYYDMSFINEYTIEPFKWLWHDVMHQEPFLFDKVYDVLVYGKENPALAVLINEQNIDEQLKNQRKLIKDYINKNNDIVKKYSKYDAKKENSQLEYEKYYIKNIPEPYKDNLYKAKKQIERLGLSFELN